LIAARGLQGISTAIVFIGDLAKKGQAGTQLSVLAIAFGLGISAGLSSRDLLSALGL